MGSASIAAMIDGDAASTECVGEFVSELRRHGRVAPLKLFAEPRRVQSQRWRALLASSNGMEFVPVARGPGSSKDPNDSAIYGEVRRVLQEPQIGAVSLLVRDKDFVPLVKDVVGSGRKCFVSSFRDRPGMAREFTRAGAQLVGPIGPQSLRVPKFICTLHGDGTGHVERAPPSLGEQLEEHPGDAAVRRLLVLGYRSHAHDPLLPSIAKFWFDNGLGRLVVYPTVCAGVSLVNAFQGRHHTAWAFGRQDLSFIFPRVPTEPTQRMLDTYGSSDCAEYARGGGPFIIRNSPTFAEDVLRKLGFVDSDKNKCIHEGLDVFASLTKNARAMRKAGVELGDFDTMLEKLDKVRSACLSNTFAGQLQMPPSDSIVRRHLVAKRALLCEAASSDEVFHAMAGYVSSLGHVPKATYNGRVMQYHNTFASRFRHPQRRQ